MKPTWPTGTLMIYVLSDINNTKIHESTGLATYKQLPLPLKTWVNYVAVDVLRKIPSSSIENKFPSTRELDWVAISLGNKCSFGQRKHLNKDWPQPTTFFFWGILHEQQFFSFSFLCWNKACINNPIGCKCANIQKRKKNWKINSRSAENKIIIDCQNHSP